MARSVSAVHDRGTLLAVALAIAFETWFAMAFCGLHLLRPDLAPARHMMSEYAVGPYGNLMTSAFVALALAILMLLVGLLRVGPASWTARTAEALFAVVVVGLTVSAIFPMDVPGAPRTTAGEIHDTSFMVNVTSSLLASVLLSVSFGSDPRWRPFRGTSLALVAAQIMAFVLQVVTIVARRNWGLANRLFVVTMVIWFLATSLRLRAIARDHGIVTAPGPT